MVSSRLDRIGHCVKIGPPEQAPDSMIMNMQEEQCKINGAAFPQENIHVRKQWLIHIHGQEFHLCLDDQGILQPFLGMAQHHQFGTLDVHFQQVESRRFRHVVQANRVHGDFLGDTAPFGETMEQVQHLGIGLQQ